MDGVTDHVLEIPDFEKNLKVHSQPIVSES